MTPLQPQPRISESELSAEEAELVSQIAAQAAGFLQIDLESTSAEEIVTKVDEYVHRMQRGTAIAPEGEQVEIFFGCLWGEQLVREFGWQWANVTLHEHQDVQAMGVFSRDRSLAIYPFHFIIGCLENAAPVTILLAFDILRDGSRVPALPLGGYENVMEHAHHTVPRDGDCS